MTKARLSLLGAIAAVTLASIPALGKIRNLPAGNPVMSVDIPDDWKVSSSKRGLEMKSPDEEVFLWIEIYLPSELEEVRGEHERYFARQKVAIVGEAKSNTQVTGNIRVVATDFPATWKGKPTVLRYLAIDPSLPAKNQILMSYWASPEGDKEYGGVVGKLIKSFDDPK